MLSVRQATTQDIFSLGASSQVLEVSNREARAVGFASATQAHLSAIAISKVAKVILDDYIPVGVFGVTEDGHFWGCLGRDVKNIFKDLVEYSKLELQELLKQFPKIEFATHQDNQFLIRWAKLLQFEVDGPYEVGPRKELFYRFHKCALQQPLQD